MTGGGGDGASSSWSPLLEAAEVATLPPLLHQTLLNSSSGSMMLFYCDPNSYKGQLSFDGASEVSPGLRE